MSLRRPSTESSDSFELLSPPLSTSSNGVIDDISSDEEEIVWNISESIASPGSVLSDEDYIVLGGPFSPPPTNTLITTTLTRRSPSVIVEDTLSTREPTPVPPSDSDTTTPPSSPTRNRRRRRVPAQRNTSPNPPAKKSPLKASSPKKNPVQEKQEHLTVPIFPSNGSPNGLGARSIVDDVSERTSTNTMLYEEAVRYINCFLSDPMEHKAAHLALLQALIIELGFFTSTRSKEDLKADCPLRGPSPTPSSTSSTFDLSDLPDSMRAAKSFIKANVFLNVREYIAVRAQGQEALQRVLHPNRRSLITQLRKKSGRVPRGWIKERGLNVFMVSCH